MKRVFFANGGGEANEGVIKLCRKYSYDKYGEGRSTIITLRDSFHGNGVIPAVCISAHGFSGDAGDAARQDAHPHGNIERSVFARHAQHHVVIARFGEGGEIRSAGGGHKRARADGVFDAIAAPVDVI